MNTKRKPATQTNLISFIIMLLCIVTLFSFSGNAYAADQSSKASSLTYQGITKVANEKKGVRITWPKTLLGSGYKIYRKTGSGSWDCIKTISNRTTVSYLDTSAENGKMYYYTVRAYLGFLLSDYNKTGLAVLRLRTPFGISKCVSDAKGQITLAWDKNGAATGYQIAYSTNSGFSGMNKAKVSKNSATLKNLTPGKKYYVKVQPYKTYNGKNYFGGFSSAKSVTVSSASGQNNTGTHVISSFTDVDNSYKYTYTFTYRSDGQINSVREIMVDKSRNKTLANILFSFTYDNKGNLISVNSANYGLFTFTYNTDGTINRIGHNRYTTYLYYQNQKLTSTSENGRKERYSYDSNGRLKQYVHSSGQTHDLTWDSHGNRSKRVLTYRYVDTYTYVNTYSGNDLVKQIEYGGIYLRNTYEFKYTSVAVPSSVKDKVEKQQWAIRNGDYLYTLGGPLCGVTVQ